MRFFRSASAATAFPTQKKVESLISTVLIIPHGRIAQDSDSLTFEDFLFQCILIRADVAVQDVQLFDKNKCGDNCDVELGRILRILLDIHGDKGGGSGAVVHLAELFIVRSDCLAWGAPVLQSFA